MESILNSKVGESQTYNDFLNAINHFVEDIGQFLQEKHKSNQEKVLVNLKKELTNTQEKFLKVCQTYNQDNIRKTIQNQKHIREQQFKTKLQKSMQINKTYEKLKKQLHEAESQEKEIINQIQYMNKQQKRAQLRRKFLQKELNRLNNKQNYNKHVQIQEKTKSQQNKMVKIMYQKNEDSQYIELLEEQIQTYSDLFEQITSTEDILAAALKKKWRTEELMKIQTNNQKIKFMEQFLSDNQVKRTLYTLLYPQEISSIV